MQNTSVFALSALAWTLLATSACRRDHDAPREAASGIPGAVTAPSQQKKTSAESSASSAEAAPQGRMDANKNVAQPSTEVPLEKWDNATFESRKVPVDGPRLYAKTRHVWIYAEPDATTQWIGYLWTGASVRLRSDKPRYGIGCNVFYAIEPRGYVCVDGGRATLDPTDPVVLATYPYAPRSTSPFLHRYGESRGTPIYQTLPSVDEQRYRESDYRAQMARVKAARDGKSIAPSLLGVDLTKSPEGTLTFPKLSPSTYEAHLELKSRSTVAYSREIRFSDRDFLLTSDFRFVPKDRVVPYDVPLFSGYHFTSGYQMVGWFRDAEHPIWKKSSDGKLGETEQHFTLHSRVFLTGNQVNQDKVRLLELTDGTWVNEADIVVPKLAAETPWGSRLEDPDNSSERPKGRATWIEVSINEGWLMAYEGHRPVFATLISPGRGGAARPGKNPLETAATPVGRFSITGKFVSSTMVAPNDYIHSEVPFAQNFTGPYALHSAYWHNRWGHPMSGGCINLSPIDALAMFQWTEPVAPAGWHGTRWLPHLEPATTLIIRR